MEKKYLADAYYFRCPNPKCGKTSLGAAYFHVFSESEIGQVKRAGLIKYTCIHCGQAFSSNQVSTNGEVNEVSKEEALGKGIDWESKGLA